MIKWYDLDGSKSYWKGSWPILCLWCIFLTRICIIFSPQYLDDKFPHWSTITETAPQRQDEVRSGQVRSGQVRPGHIIEAFDKSCGSICVVEGRTEHKIHMSASLIAKHIRRIMPCSALLRYLKFGVF